MKKITTLAMALCLVSSVGSAAAVGDYYISGSIGGVKSGVKHKSGGVPHTIRATGLTVVSRTDASGTALGRITRSSALGAANYNSTLSVPKSKSANSLMTEFAFGTYLMPNVRTEVALSYVQHKSKKQIIRNTINDTVELSTNPNMTFGDPVAQFTPGSSGGTAVDSTAANSTFTPPAPADVPAQTFNTGLNAKTLAIMLNAYYDIKMSEMASPYVMAGFGYGQTKYSTSGRSIFASKPKKGKKGGFAWQVGAGVDFNVAEATTLGFGYRLRSGGAKVKKDQWRTLEPSAKLAHVLLANVRFSF